MNCSSCRYWVPQQIIGVCKRYPEAVNKPASDWCGEFRPSAFPPAIEPPAPPAAEPSAPKRRGRPPKTKAEPA